jgi:hypothetical protein
MQQKQTNTAKRDKKELRSFLSFVICPALNGYSQKRYWLMGLGMLLSIAIVLIGYGQIPRFTNTSDAEAVFAQSPRPGSVPRPGTPPTPAVPPVTSPGTLPQVPLTLPKNLPTVPPVLPASTAPPTPLQGNYRDPVGRFQVGILKGYNVSPLAGSILVEAADGNLAYAVVAQSQPPGEPVGLSPAGLENEILLRIAATLFQRGEGFQPGEMRLETGGGVVINWTGNLTIAGNTQPVGGVILVRPSQRTILLLLITATQAGANRLPGAISALANSLQIL